MKTRYLYLILILAIAVSVAAGGCGSGGGTKNGNQNVVANPNPVILPNDPNADKLNNGKLVKGVVNQDCDNSVVLDTVNTLCEIFKLANGDGKEACINQTSSCNSYERQIFTGSVLGPGQKGPNSQWNDRGGSGALMADAAICTLRELSPKVPGGGPVQSSTSLNIGIGDVVVKQEVGYLDFDRIFGRFKGYRKLRIELPVVGKFDAVTQDIDVARVFYSTGQLFNSVPKAGDYPLLSAYGLNLSTEEKDKHIDINPGSFNVETPIGTFSVSPHFKYESNTVVADTPFGTDYTYIILPDDSDGPDAIKLYDLYGVVPGINNNTVPPPSSTTTVDYKEKQTGWVSQIGLGTRRSIDDKLWSPPSSGFFTRPDYDPTGVLKFQSYESRSEEENRKSVYAEASASFKYPENPADMLPEWVDGLPGLDWDAYIKVTPTIKAGAAGQFGIAVSEGTDNKKELSGEFYVGKPNSRTSALGVYSGVEANASFEVLAELRLYVSAVFDFFFGSKKIDLIDIHPKFPIPIAGGKPVSSKVELATAYSSSDNSPDLPETLDYLKTFKGPKLSEEFINLCYAKEAEVPAENPPCTTEEDKKNLPECQTEKGDVTDLFEYLPCNICLATDAVIDPKTGEVKEPAHKEILSPVNPTPPAVWQCDAASKSGCMDLCKLNKETGQFTVVKNPSQIADSIPTTDPDYNKLYPFYKSCMITCNPDLPPGILDTSCGKGLDSTPPSTFGIMVPGGGGGAPAPVPVDTSLAAPFSEPMDPASINTSTFTVSDADGNGIAGTVSYDGATYTATFSPSRNLDYNRTYTATITTGVTDLAGNPLATDFSWNFTTVSAPAAEVRTAFVTSVQGNGNLGTWADAGGKAGLEAGDAICQARATAAGLSGTYVAWLSDYYNDAYCRVHNLTGKKSANCGQGSLPVAAGPWVRTDGFPFSETVDQLVNDGKVYAPVMYDESGNAFVGSQNYMTGTQEDGTYDPTGSTFSCYDWTSNTSNSLVHAVGGFTDGTTYSWTHNYGGACNSSSWHLLCLETGPGLPLPPFATTGKKVFVTSSSGTGDLGTWPGAGVNRGVAAGDAICQSKAAEAGLANSSNFKAWLSSYISGTNYVNAKDRLTSNGPWVRPDGVKVADNKADLTDGYLFTAISQTETGAYLSTTTWTGTYYNGTLESTISNCEGWTTTSPARGEGSLGESSLSDGNWTKTGYNPCSTLRHLYCFED